MVLEEAPLDETDGQSDVAQGAEEDNEGVQKGEGSEMQNFFLFFRTDGPSEIGRSERILGKEM